MVLRLEPRHGRTIDRALGVVQQVTLVRRRDGTFADASTGSPELIRALAFAGIEAEAVEEPSMPSTAVRMTGLGLAPLSRELVVADLVHVRRVPLGDATRQVLRRRLPRFRAPSQRARRRCRDLLRGDDLLLAWSREVWIEPARMLEVRLRSPLGIRAPIGSNSAERGLSLAFGSEGRLGAWAFA